VLFRCNAIWTIQCIGTFSYFPQLVVVHDGYSYVDLNYDVNRDIVGIVNANDPYNPYFVNYYEYDDSGGCLNVYNDILYYPYGSTVDWGVASASLIDPENPELLSTCTIPTLHRGGPNAIQEHWTGSYMYIHNMWELIVVNITDPMNMYYVTHIPLTEYQSEDMFIRDDHLFLAAGHCYVVDIQDPSNPVVLYMLDEELCYSVYCKDNYLYCGGIFRIYDISNINDPQQVYFNIEFIANDIVVVDNICYLASNEGIYALDISNVSKPKVVGCKIYPHNTDEIIYDSGYVHCASKFSYQILKYISPTPTETPIYSYTPTPTDTGTPTKTTTPTSTITPTFPSSDTPTATPTSTYTPTPFIDLYIGCDQSDYGGGDTMVVSIGVENPVGEMMVDLYIAVEIPTGCDPPGDCFYFYPDFTNYAYPITFLLPICDIAPTPFLEIFFVDSPPDMSGAWHAALLDNIDQSLLAYSTFPFTLHP